MDEEEKRALAGLWSVPGLGPKTLADLRKKYGPLGRLTQPLIGEWLERDDLLPYADEHIPRSCTLGELGDQLLAAAKRFKMQIAWRGEAGYPARLAETADAPPLLFYWGPGNDGPPRRRVAMVGTRQPVSINLGEVKAVVKLVAEHGVGVVSGAAMGIDTLAHREAMKGKRGETWAFVGSSLDQLDPPQRQLWDDLKAKGVTFWSELPPGVRAERKTFPRRNRLISGCADAVVVLRAGPGSGCKHTVKYSLDQGRPVLAMPGGFRDSIYCNQLIAIGAGVVLDGRDVLRAVGVSGFVSQQPPPDEKPRVPLTSLSADAQTALRRIDRTGKCFDQLLVELDVAPGRLLSALGELIETGYVHEHAGRRYERVE
ncbi:MAG: DNA-protecting protein DprA [Archangiaceae bacterium]|nr:DNA-protecting protein DprA [Archangiaceae bacterium]